MGALHENNNNNKSFARVCGNYKAKREKGPALLNANSPKCKFNTHDPGSVILHASNLNAKLGQQKREREIESFLSKLR